MRESHLGKLKLDATPFASSLKWLLSRSWKRSPQICFQFNSPGRFSSASSPALICTHLYNLFNSVVQMGREFSWQGVPLDQNCFCLNFQTVSLWSNCSDQKVVESRSPALKPICFSSLSLSLVWITLQSEDETVEKRYMGKCLSQEPRSRRQREYLQKAAQQGQIRAI